MKKLFLALAAMAMVLSGCSKFEEDIANLNNRIDNIEKVTIPSINSQISSINSTISSLKSINMDLDSEISNLSEKISNLGQNISSIEKLISALDGNIGQLESVLASIRKSITDLETESANNLANVKADLETKIGNLNGELDSLVDDLAALSAQDQELILELASLKNKDQELENKIIELQTYIDDELSKAVDAATAAYATLEHYNAVLEQLASLDESISTTDTEIKAKIATEIANLEARIAELNERLDKLEEDIESVLSRIQSIAYVPTTSNGKAAIYYNMGDDGSLDKGGSILTFEVRPASVAATLVADWRNTLNVKAAYTQTRSAIEFTNLAVEDAVATAEGFMQIAISGEALKSEFFSGQASANICLEVSDKNSTFSTEYVNIIPWNDSTVYVPDFKFHAYLVENFDTNNDKKISISEAGTIKNIDVAGLLSAPSLKGVGYCANLTRLCCADNNLEEININNLVLLEEVDMSGNKLSSLDISNLTALKYLDLSENKLESLDVNNLSNLLWLNISNNRFSTIDISALVNMTSFYAYQNNLSALDVSQNTSLTHLGCSYNELSTIDLRPCDKLVAIYISNNKLTNLNISNNTLFTIVDCHSNPQLSTLMVWEGFTQDSRTIIADNNLNVMNVVGSNIEVTKTSPEDIPNTIPMHSCGELIYKHGKYGVVFYSDNVVTKIVSVEETIATWDDAKSWCSNYGSGWYLPSLDELRIIYKNKSTINSTLSANGYTTLGTGMYWSSTEHDYYNAYGLDFSDGSSYYSHDKDNSYDVRAVLAF